MTLQALGDVAGARDLLQRTYDTRRRVLGEDHSATLTSAGNLAETLRALGDLAAGTDSAPTPRGSWARTTRHPGSASNRPDAADLDLRARDLHQRTYDTRGSGARTTPTP